MIKEVRFIAKGERPAVKVARTFANIENLPYNLKRKYLDENVHAFSENGHVSLADEEYWQLRKELNDLKMERDILFD